MSFYRIESRPFRTIAWSLGLSLATLKSWDQEFDPQLRPYKKSDKRGKAAKVDMETIRQIVDKAKALKEQGRRLRLKRFTRELQMVISSTTVRDILIANDLWAPQTRKRNPSFYQNLCQQIPNGLLSLDGSSIEVRVGDLLLGYNLELGVDTDSFYHTAHEITPTETGSAVLSVLKKHEQAWGTPLGVIYDRGSANLSESVTNYLKSQGIQILTAGPNNPKGNGTDEGAFSQLKQAIGDIHIDTSSPYALGKSVLEMLVSLYIQMRNKMALRGPRPSPEEQMQRPVSKQDKEQQKAHLQEQIQKKTNDDAHQAKIDRLHWLINYYNMSLTSAEVQRARHCLKGYDQEAMIQAEEAFLRAVNRDRNCCNLAYFFGILKNIQQDLDDQRYRKYCRQRYSYQLHLENQRMQQESQNECQASVEGVLKLVVTAMGLSEDFIRKKALGNCKRKLKELLSSISYIGPLKKRFQEAIGARTDLDLQQKEKAYNWVESLINETAAA